MCVILFLFLDDSLFGTLPSFFATLALDASGTDEDDVAAPFLLFTEDAEDLALDFLSFCAPVSCACVFVSVVEDEKVPYFDSLQAFSCLTFLPLLLAFFFLAFGLGGGSGTPPFLAASARSTLFLRLAYHLLGWDETKQDRMG